MERYGLLSRSGYWYFRIRVPVGLQRLLKCREIKRSLGKCDLNLAEPAAKLARLKLKEIFTQVYPVLSRVPFLCPKTPFGVPLSTVRKFFIPRLDFFRFQAVSEFTGTFQGEAEMCKALRSRLPGDWVLRVVIGA